MTRTRPHPPSPFLEAPVCCGSGSDGLDSPPRPWPFALPPRSAIGVVGRVEGFEPPPPECLDLPSPRPSVARNPPNPVKTFRGWTDHETSTRQEYAYLFSSRCRSNLVFVLFAWDLGRLDHGRP